MNVVLVRNPPVDEMCNICHEDFLDQNQGPAVRGTKCHPTHLYHKNCLHKWIQIKPSCPLDRELINPRSFDNLFKRIVRVMILGILGGTAIELLAALVVKAVSGVVLGTSALAIIGSLGAMGIIFVLAEQSFFTPFALLFAGGAAKAVAPIAAGGVTAGTLGVIILASIIIPIALKVL